MKSFRMPALFIGHGSPMNTLENNRYTRMWQDLGKSLSRPSAILAVSAHWYTEGAWVTAMEKPKTIHDFSGFPAELAHFDYPALGAPELAQQLQHIVQPVVVRADERMWGLDHGTWSILAKMYPEADIPVIQLSIDGTQSAEYHYQLGKKLSVLRDQGVLILASGNVVHNLRRLKWRGDDTPYAWAENFNRFVRENLSYQGDTHPLVHYMQHPDAKESHPSAEHYLPLLYALGAWNGKEPITTLIDGIEKASLSMLSVQIG